MLLGSLDGLGTRLRAAAEALPDTAGVEAAWLRGAADLVERDEAERHALRAEAVWLEELPAEARARRASLLSDWVDAAEALRTAIHTLETERGPLVESLFPVWRGPSLRRHADQARAAESDLQRRLSSGYVVRRLAELATHTALGSALEALAGAGAAWAADRDRPPLAGAEADAMRARLLGLAGRTARLLERVRWLVRAALAERPELVDEVFPKRGRTADSAADSPGTAAPAEGSAPAEDVAATEPAPRASAEAAAPSTPRPGGRRRRPAAPPGSRPADTEPGPAPDGSVSRNAAGAEATTRGKDRSTRAASGAARNVPADRETATDSSSERISGTHKVGRVGGPTRPAPPAGGPPRPRKDPATGVAGPSGRSMNVPGSATAAAAPSRRGNRRSTNAPEPASAGTARSTGRSAAAPAEVSVPSPSKARPSPTGSGRKHHPSRGR